ncbi:MAG: hypothetical protein MJ137_00790 [Clostridia bacterium]|nr:hypothetical protein [Clostridia bacterium]
MIEFVYGNHGTGKTEYIYESLKKDASAGIRSFLIVPEQAAVSTEKQALERLPDSAQLTFEVLNFSRMSNRVFREYGGITYKTLSPGTKKVLMMRALSKTAHLLGEYEEAAKSDKGFPDLMLKTVKELGNCGLPFEELEKIAASAKAPLASKLSAVLTCAAAFKELSKGAGDTDSDTEKLADCLEKNAFFKGSHVYIDSFSGLTGVQHRIIKSIFSQADRTVVSVPLPSPSHRGTDTVSLRRMSDRLRADAAATGLPTSTLILDENKRASHGDLALVADGLWDNHTGGDKRDGSVSVITAENIFDEAEFAAGLSRKLIEDGMRCRDIVLVSRNPEAYKGIIDAAFEEAGVPFWISDKQPLSLTSPARLVLSALRIIEYGWLREDVTSHLRTGLCGIDSDSADIFVAYADKWRISGKGFTSGDFVMNPSGYEAEFTEYDRRVLQTANKVRKEITSSLSEFGEAVNAAEDCRGICRAIYSYLLRLDIKDRLLAEATLALKEGRRGEANELAHTFSAFTKALEELSDAYGDAQKPSVHEFTAALAAILEASEIGSIPASSDAVTFSSADLLRAESPACVMLLGVKDGTFPATPSGRGLLSDEDRSELMSTPGISLSDRTSAASDELYYFRRAAAQASDKLFIFRTKDTPSVPVSKIRRMLPGIDETVTSDCPEIRIASRSVAKAWLPLLNGTAVGVSEKPGRNAVPPVVRLKRPPLLRAP